MTFYNVRAGQHFKMADEEKVESGGDSSEKEDTPVTNGLPESAEPTTGASTGSKKKRKKKKGKKKDETAGLVPSTQALAQLQKAMGKLRFNDAMSGKGREKGNVFEKKYEFWDTQPVPKLSEYMHIVRIFMQMFYFGSILYSLYRNVLSLSEI
jgi:hypothetical protein